jgi:hypothetical protein
MNPDGKIIELDWAERKVVRNADVKSGSQGQRKGVSTDVDFSTDWENLGNAIPVDIGDEVPPLRFNLAVETPRRRFANGLAGGLPSDCL